MTNNPLIQAPPRISDLHGDARTEALTARAAEHRANWLETRQRVPLITRVMERIFS